MCARRTIVSSLYTTPLGLLGELTKTAAVFSLIALSSFSKSIWKVSGSESRATSDAPAVSVKTLYSVK